jgi:hypothetical protein
MALSTKVPFLPVILEVDGKSDDAPGTVAAWMAK